MVVTDCMALVPIVPLRVLTLPLGPAVLVVTFGLAIVTTLDFTRRTLQSSLMEAENRGKNRDTARRQVYLQQPLCDYLRRDQALCVRDLNPRYRCYPEEFAGDLTVTELSLEIFGLVDAYMMDGGSLEYDSESDAVIMPKLASHPISMNAQTDVCLIGTQRFDSHYFARVRRTRA